MTPINRSISFAVIMLFMLSACGGGSSSGGGSGTGAVTTALLTGTWKSECFQDDDGMGNDIFVVITFVITATTVEGSANIYDELDTTCTGAFTAELLGTSTYTLGATVTVDGSVAGITTATKIDITDPGPPPEVEYEIVAVKDNRLYLGDTDGVNDGSSDALRPTQLDGDSFATRQ